MERNNENFNRGRIGFLPGGRLTVMVVMLLSSLALRAEPEPMDNYRATEKITIDVKNVPVTEVIRQIEEATEFLFTYNEDDVRDVTATVAATDAGIDAVLGQALKNTGLTYVITDRHVMLSRSSASAAPSDNRPADRDRKRSVTGRVADADNVSLPGVSVLEKGTTNGVSTNMQGEFTITVNEGAVLVFSFLGYNTQERQTGQQTRVNIVMEESLTVLDEVVVTALGIKKLEKSLGYSLQQINAEAFEKIKTDNPLNILNGKVAGLTVNTRAGILEDPAIKLRGEEPIYVVNGTPVDYYRAVAPDDIESMTVLKGPQAAALYGSRGANGAILITTKTGASGSKTAEVTVNSSNMFTAGYLSVAEQQTVYGTGDYGQYSYFDGKGNGVYDGLWTWGPKMDRLDPTTPSGYWETVQYNSPVDPETGERVPLPWLSHKNNFRKFMRTGIITNNNVSITKSFDSGSMRVSVNQMYRRGQMPNSDLNRMGITMATNYDITSRFHLNANMIYSYTYTKNRPWSGYGNQHPYYNILVYMGANVDIKDLKDYWEPGQEGYQQRNWNHIWFNNPWFVAYEYERPYSEPELLANISFDYDILPGLKATIKAATDSKEQHFEVHKPYAWVADDYGQYEVTSNRNVKFDMDFLLTYDRSFGRFDVDALFGASYQHKDRNQLYASTVGGLEMPDLYSLSNSVMTPTALNDSESGGPLIQRDRMSSVFGTATLGYNGALYLTFTGRNDWSSRLTKKNRSFFYPSVSFSGIVSELVRMPRAISFAKVRASWAKIGRVMDIYQLQEYYSLDQYWSNTPAYRPASVLVDPNIKPYYTTSTEVGVDFRFLRNRLRFDASYYTTLDEGEIMQVETTTSSGFQYILTNGNDYKRTGVEIDLGGTPIDSGDWKWDIDLNWSRSRKTLHSIYNDEPRYNNYKVGDRADGIYSKVWQRDPDGNFIVYENNGRPIEDPYNRIIGYSMPDWEFGISTRLRWRKWNLSMDFSGRFGGVVRSQLNARMIQGGTHKKTAVKERELDWSRVDSYLPSNAVIVTGGEVRYDEYGTVVSDNRTYGPSYTPISFKSWIGYIGQLSGPWTMGYNLYKMDFVKLRTMALSYDFTDMVKQVKFIKGLEVSVIGNNLWMWKRMDNEDPDANYMYFSYPTERMIGFNIKITL